VSSLEAHALYAAVWATFGIGHSLLAGQSVKARLRPFLGAFHRLAYNLFAGAHLGLVWATGAMAFAGAPAYSFQYQVALTGIQVVGWLVLLVGLMSYDLGRFAGSKQIRGYFQGVKEPEDEPLRISGPHRFVRHPLYAGVVLILWARVADELSLATAVWGSIYLFAGTLLEERKLLGLHGRAYAEYRGKVPAIVPWKGRAI
jgi:protein-S-isoprenylcysteine O-methyltransferase Ste14